MMSSFKIFARVCLGVHGRRLWRTVIVCLLVYGALSPLNLRLATAPFVFCVMPGLFSAGVMAHALQAKARAVQLRHLLMLPQNNGALVYGYVGALAIYVLLTKTAPLLTLMLALLDWQGQSLVAAFLGSLNGVVLTALTIAWRKHGRVIIPWVFLLGLLFWWLGAGWWLSVVLVVSGLAAVWLLARVDAYAFLRQSNNGRPRRSRARHGLMLHYFVRYLWAQKNYLVNTLALWVLAVILPLLLYNLADSTVAAPLGMALLTLNTPLGILLSCDPALETVVRALPQQRRRFCLPYAGLLAGSVLFSEALYLMSWQYVYGNVTWLMIALAVYVAIQSALASVWLEWYRPLKNWRIESDLWHHPRKYLVPGAMLLLTIAVSSWPLLLLPLSMALVAEMTGWLKRAGDK